MMKHSAALWPISYAAGLWLRRPALLLPRQRIEVNSPSRLDASCIDIAGAQSQDRLIFLDAQETLDRFIVNGWPDDRRFSAVISEVLNRASQRDRKVRAFGEMVALMWAKGHCGATVRLEQIWTDLCRRESLPLFCAYPKVGFTEDAAQSIARVCAAHSKVLAV